MAFKVVILSAILAIASSQHHASSYSSINFGGHEQQQHYQHAAAPLLVKAPVAAYHAPALIKAPVYAHHEEYPDAHPAYSYKYGVEDSHTHDIKSQEESRDGDVVKGSYTLLQPDGVTRTVHYTADKSGFNAQVDYSGHAGHPQHVQKAVIAKAVVAPVYHQAPVYNYHH